MKEIFTSNPADRTHPTVTGVDGVPRRPAVPRSERIHIGLLGRRNAGKSSLLNALAGQEAAVVSATPGTTTDPVFKAMELQPLGPVVFVDTAGLDDEGEVGTLRVERTRKVLRRLDVALLVIDAAALSRKALTRQTAARAPETQETGARPVAAAGGGQPGNGDNYEGDDYEQFLGEERAILTEFRRRHPNAPVVVVWNKIDRLEPERLALEAVAGNGRDGKGNLLPPEFAQILAAATAFLQDGGQGSSSSRSPLRYVAVSARTGQGIDQLKQLIIAAAQEGGSAESVPLVEDLVAPGDTVILVTPIDSEAPAGRLILPQQQVLRALLDHGVVTLVVRETELAAALNCLCHPPSLVITDSQAFAQVAQVLPADVPLTSFSILFARYKGDLEQLLAGVEAVARLKPGDRVLVAEACTHSPPTEVDIGRVKIPRLLEARVGGKLEWTWFTGYDFPAELQPYCLVIHCGGCMLNRREMQSRLQLLRQAGVPVVNYGVILAYLTGILPRAVQPLRLPRSSQRRAGG
ncbi:MAG TPA: [FeFe] hydrogenase H-cluster maturation GTPase HydF [Firmicutes bacterium]|nr:[FeFe] hydrogenase H-cluster maturation GTPase HydF [Bacillota bacterium]